MQQPSTPSCPILTPIRLVDVFGDDTTFQYNIREYVSGNNFRGWNSVGNMKVEDVDAILVEDQKKLNALNDAWKSYHLHQMNAASRENQDLERRIIEQEKLKLKDEVEKLEFISPCILFPSVTYLCYALEPYFLSVSKMMMVLFEL